MKITDGQVRHVAHLARIELEDDEAACYRGELDAVLAYMDMLGEVDTAGVPSTHHPLPVTNALREDGNRPGQTLFQALANAPDNRDGFIAVPRVID